MKSNALVSMLLLLSLFLLGFMLSEQIHLKSELKYLKDENQRLRQVLDDQQIESIRPTTEYQALHQEIEHSQHSLAAIWKVQESQLSDFHGLQLQELESKIPGVLTGALREA